MVFFYTSLPKLSPKHSIMMISCDVSYLFVRVFYLLFSSFYVSTLIFYFCILYLESMVFYCFDGKGCE